MSANLFEEPYHSWNDGVPVTANEKAKAKCHFAHIM